MTELVSPEPVTVDCEVATVPATLQKNLQVRRKRRNPNNCPGQLLNRASIPISCATRPLLPTSTSRAPPSTTTALEPALELMASTQKLSVLCGLRLAGVWWGVSALNGGLELCRLISNRSDAEKFRHVHEVRLATGSSADV